MTAPEDGSAVTSSEGATCYRHGDRPTNIRCTRCNNPICPECMTPAAVGFQCPSCIRQGRATVRTPTGVFGGRVSTGAPVTLTLLTLNVLAFLATTSSSGLVSGGTQTGRFDALAQVGGPTGFPGNGGVIGEYGISHGEYYRIVSAMFLHYGIIHIASNMFVLYLVGPQLERVLGWWRFLATYVIAGIGGGVATYVFADPHQQSAGASGAIFGLFAAYVVIARKLSADLSGIVSTIVLNLVITFAVPGISITDHIGGLVTGGVVGLVITRLPRRPAAVGGCLVGVLAALVVLALARTSSLS